MASIASIASMASIAFMAFGDMRQDVKQDVFAGPLPANNAGHLAVLDIGGDIPEGLDGVVFPGKGALLNL